MKKQSRRPKTQGTAPAKSAETAPAAGRRRRLRKWAARLLAVVLAPVLFLLLLEVGLRLFGYGYPTGYFIRAEEGEAYLSNPRFAWRFVGPELNRLPIPTIISARKPAGTYRIFVFGGSAAQGIPNWAFSFARILEAMLNERYAPTRFEVINTGMTAINSHVVLPIARDCAEFDGDLYVVYMGNNEVVGPYGAGTVIKGFNPSLGAIRASIRLRSTRVGQLLGSTIKALGVTRPGQAKTWGGMGMFVENRVAADDPRLASVYDNFRANLSDICRVAQAAGAKVIVSTVVTNLKDCPPFASVHRGGLSDAEKARWDKLYAEGTTLAESGDHEQAVGRYQAAAKIDDRFAELHFRLAHSLLALERSTRAREHFVLARDLDALRFRADTRINDIIRQVAGGRQAEGVYLVDAERTVAQDQMPGFELLYEHVHFTFEGKYAVAAAIFERVAQVLPQDLRGGVAADPAPPSLQRCAELVMFTPADRAADAMEMAKTLNGPPFSKEQYARVMGLHLRLRKQLPLSRLALIAERYREVLTARPNDLAIRSNFAHLQRVRRDYAAMDRQYRRLLDRYPYYPRWRYSLAEALENQGKLVEAIEQYRRALSVCPAEVFALRSLAKVLDKNGQVREAIEYYRRTLELAPDAVSEAARLAWIYATSPDDALRDGAEAVRLAEHACQVGARAPILLDVLAAAYAENGQFKEAVETARKAQATAEAEGRTNLARQIATRLKLYQAGRAFRRIRPR